MTNLSSIPSASRRAILKIGLGTALTGLLAPYALGETPPVQPAAFKPVADPAPIVDARFPCEIAQDVWLIPDRRINASLFSPTPMPTRSMLSVRWPSKTTPRSS